MRGTRFAAVIQLKWFEHLLKYIRGLPWQYGRAFKDIPDKLGLIVKIVLLLFLLLLLLLGLLLRFVLLALCRARASQTSNTPVVGWLNRAACQLWSPNRQSLKISVVGIIG